MDKSTIRIVEAKVYNKLEEFSDKGKYIPPTIRNIIAVIDEIGHLKEKPKDKTIITVEVIGD